MFVLYNIYIWKPSKYTIYFKYSFWFEISDTKTVAQSFILFFYQMKKDIECFDAWKQARVSPCGIFKKGYLTSFFSTRNNLHISYI